MKLKTIPELLLTKDVIPSASKVLKYHNIFSSFFCMAVKHDFLP
jgi:hypothetical protein